MISILTHFVNDLKEFDQGFVRSPKNFNQIHPSILLFLLIAYILSLNLLSAPHLLGMVSLGAFVLFFAIWLRFPWKLLRYPLLISLVPVLVISLPNLWLDSRSITILGISFSTGWILCLYLVLKNCLAISGTMVIAYGLGIMGIYRALRTFMIPHVICEQILLTYRYLFLFTEILINRERSFFLRTQRQIKLEEYGGIMGILLAQSLFRAIRLTFAIRCRCGGTLYPLSLGKKSFDSSYSWHFSLGILLIWLLFFFTIQVLF